QLKHYSGGTVLHHYYDHHSQQHRRQILSQEEMIRRYVSHIPARHFKMIRYYGFLANRKRGHLLPKVYDALDMIHPNVPEKPGFAALTKGFLNTDPYQCILCGNRLRFMSAEKGLHAVTLLSERRDKMAKKRWLQTAA
ncbi:TPA: transposase, partial [Klebsiella pneumoniae]|nr:transposase [Klebsiella pneumoniae]